MKRKPFVKNSIIIVVFSLVATLVLTFLYIIFQPDPYEETHGPYNWPIFWLASEYFDLDYEPQPSTEIVEDYLKDCSYLLNLKFEKAELFKVILHGLSGRIQNIEAFYATQTYHGLIFRKRYNGYTSMNYNDDHQLTVFVQMDTSPWDQMLPIEGQKGKRINYEITNDLVQEYLGRVDQSLDTNDGDYIVFTSDYVDVYFNDRLAASFDPPK